MKPCLVFLLGTLITLVCCNHDKVPEINSGIENFVSNTVLEKYSNEIAGNWERVASGEDANSNGILEEAEKLSPSKAGSYEYLNFYTDGKYFYSGVLGSRIGNYTVRNVNGKKLIFLYTDDMPPGLSEKDKEKWATKMELTSVKSNELILIAPIHSSMLIVYHRFHWNNCKPIPKGKKSDLPPIPTKKSKL